MALKNLTTEVMIGLSAAWLDGQRARIAQSPRLAPLLADLDAAHQALLRTQPGQPPELVAAVKAVQAEEAERDLVHDRKLRGTYHVLSGLAELTDDRERARTLLAARDRLFPEGLSATQRTYLAQAGEAELARSRLDEGTRALLAGIPLGGAGTLLDAVTAWFDAGKELGALEQRRLGLEQQAAGVASIRPADVVRARNGWIRAVRAFEALLELDTDLGDADKQALVAALREAEARAERRAPVEPAVGAAPAADAPGTSGAAPVPVPAVGAGGGGGPV